MHTLYTHYLISSSPKPSEVEQSVVLLGWPKSWFGFFMLQKTRTNFLADPIPSRKAKHGLHPAGL